jgi:hypothetical protein
MANLESTRPAKSSRTSWLFEPPFLLSCPFIGLLVFALATSPPVAAEVDEPPITPEDREHWSFRPLVRPAAPAIAANSSPRNPIDRFIFATLHEEGLDPYGEADRTTLIRRLYFDLLGLPPSPAEVAAFHDAPSHNAYEQLVDRLLASPRYGERWAQHWLDLARFAETDGFEHDKVRPDAWRFRDWVISALNSDLPYDRFVSLQLAGDELEPENESARIATAFCLSGPDMPDINSQEERRHYVLNEMTSTVGEVLLGLQVGCAQCHDHKYDPVSQADFYRMRSLFEPAVRVKRNESVGVLDETGSVPVSHLMIRGDFRRPGPVLQPAFPRIVNPSELVSIKARETSSGRRAALSAWITQEDHPLTARVIANRIWQHHFGEGLSLTPSDFGVIGDEPLHLELLDWLASELVHKKWSLKQLHRIVVTSATYRRASRTRHSAETRDQTAEQDPTNRYFAHFPAQRLSGETIRDAMLSAAGMLDVRQGGPGVRPPLPTELVQTLLVNQWDVSPNRADHYRRSIYVFARRNLRYPIFEAFDRPDANTSCPSRSESTTAPQSLLLLNSEFSLELARRFAGRVMAAAGNDVQQQIEFAVQIAFGRSPRTDETRLLLAFVESQVTAFHAAGREEGQLVLPEPCPAGADHCSAAALTDVCLALFNASEFLYID